MSVREVQYIVYGIKLSVQEYKERYNPENNEDLEDTLHEQYKGRKPYNKLNVIYDGMNEDYVVIGKVIIRAESYDGEGMPLTRLVLDMDEETLIAQSLSENFGISRAEQQRGKLYPTFWAFTHYQ